MTSIHALIEANDVKGIRRILASNPGALNEQNEYGKSPLYRAVDISSKELVEILLAAGANVDLPDKEGKSPLYWAVDNGNKELVELLLAAGANVDSLNMMGESPLFLAVAGESESTEIVKALLAAGANVDLQNNDRWSPLYRAVFQRSSKELVEILLAAGANVDLPDKRGITPYNFAKWSRSPEIATLLNSYKNPVETTVTPLPSSANVSTSLPITDEVKVESNLENVPLDHIKESDRTTINIEEKIQTVCQLKTMKWNRSKIMIVGEGRAGKTALSNSIIGKTFITTDSTIGINNLSCSINYADVSNGQWNLYDRPEKELETAIAMRIREQQIKDSEKIKGKIKDDTATQAEIGEPIKAKDSDNKKVVEDNQPVTMTPVIAAPKPGEIDNDFVAKCLADKIQTSSDVIISLFDFGGQSVFDVIHHLFLTPYGVYIVVFNMTWLMKEVSETDRASCWSRLVGWINSIVLHTSEVSDNSRTSFQSARLVFVGTCKDKIKAKISSTADERNFLQDISKKLESMIINFRDRVLWNEKEELWFFPVDNRSGRGDSSLIAMLQSIEDSIKNSDHVIQEKPLIWLQALDGLKARKDITAYTMTKVCEIFSACGIENRSYSEALSFFNKMGELLWINEDGLRNTIIMDPVSFFVTPATRVICKQMASEERGETYFHEDKVQRECKHRYSIEWESMITTGVVSGDLLQALVGSHYEVIISLMIKFGLIVPVLSQEELTNEEKTYIVPSLLHPITADKQQQFPAIDQNDLQHSFLFYFSLPTKSSSKNKFLTDTELASKGYLPSGLFLRYLGKLLTWSQLLTPGYNPWSDQIFNNHANIRVGQRTFSIALHEEFSAICITVEDSRNHATLLLRLKELLNEAIKECFGLLNFEVLVLHSETVDGKLNYYYIPLDLVNKACKSKTPLCLSKKVSLGSKALKERYSKWWELHDTTQNCDVFLSYRRGEHDTRFVSLIYDALLDCDYAYVFQDVQVKMIGNNLQVTSSKALITAKVFVPFCSHDALVMMKDHNPEVVDNLLLEWILALECQEKCSLNILPISYGSIDETNNFIDFDDQDVCFLPEIIPNKTIDKAISLLTSNQITPSPELHNQTVKNIVENILSFTVSFQASEFKRLKECIPFCISSIQEAYPEPIDTMEPSQFSSQLPPLPILIYCLICRDEVSTSLGIKCSTCPSFVCDVCFNNLVKNQIDQINVGNFMQRKGKIICKNSNCTNLFTEKELFDHCDQHTYKLYTNARDKVIGQLQVEEQLPVLKKMWLVENNNNEIDRHYHHIIDTILTLRCPCGTPFLFNPKDCLALLCSRCGHYFCGWCLLSCGNATQAHDHLSACAGKLYCTEPEFERVHDQRKLVSLRAYLRSIPREEIRKQVVDVIASRLSDDIKDALEIGFSSNNDVERCNLFFNLDVTQLKYEKTEANLVENGSFGEVYYGEWGGSQPCVVECLNDLKSISAEEATKIYKKIKITLLSNHANLHKILGVSLTEGLLVSMPYDTSLFNFLYVNSTVNSITLSSVLKLTIIKDIACAVEYLHEHGVVHGDIRPNNILLVFSVDRNVTVAVTAQVTGFVVPRSLEHGNQPPNSTTGQASCVDVPPYFSMYFPPEFIHSPTFTKCTDIYALGVTMNEIMTVGITQPMEEDISKRPPLFVNCAWTDSEKILGELIGNENKGCLSAGASERPTASEVLREINKLREAVVDDHSPNSGEQIVVGEFTGYRVLNDLRIMKDIRGLYIEISESSVNHNLCYQLRGSELFLLAHYYRDRDSGFRESYDFVVGNLIQQVAPEETKYVIADQYKVMRDALGFYTCYVKEGYDKMRPIYGKDLLNLSFEYFKNDKCSMSTNCYYFLQYQYPEVIKQLINRFEKVSQNNFKTRNPSLQVDDDRSMSKSITSNNIHTYLTYGLLSTGSHFELSVERDWNYLKDYCKRYNEYGGCVLLEGNVGLKENFIANLFKIYLPTAQSKKSDLVLYYGGHGNKSTGDWLIAHGGQLADIFSDNSGNPVYKLFQNKKHSILTFEDLMKTINNFNETFNPRVKVHIVLFSCYSGHWIRKLKEAREKDATKYPDIGIILTAADEAHECTDVCFVEAFWGKSYGTNNEVLTRACVAGPQKYISGIGSNTALYDGEMTLEDFNYHWFKRGHHWQLKTDTTINSADTKVGVNNAEI